MRSGPWAAPRPGARPRRAPVLATLVVGGVVLALGAAPPPAAQAVTTTVGRPTFWTCVDPPALPGNAPGSGAAWIAGRQQRCGEDRITGMHVTATHVPAPGGPAGDVTVGWIETKGVVGRTTGASQQCGDQQRAFLFSVPIWFSAPATEFHLEALCCEWTFKGDTQTWLTHGPKPAGAAPIPQGEQAALAGTTAAQLAAAVQQVQNGVSSIWGHDYEYDGCNPTAPQTRCNRVHCLSFQVYRAQPEPGGKATGTLVTEKDHGYDG